MPSTEPNPSEPIPTEPIPNGPIPTEPASADKRADAEKFAPEETQRTFRGLAVFLRQTRDFRLAVALYNDPIARDGMIRSLTEELAKVSMRILVLDLRRPSAESTLLGRVGELTAGNAAASRAVVMVVNLESYVEYNPELPLPDGPGMDFLAAANLQRELFAAACPGPLVLWMTELLERAFVSQAPDLWRWRSHDFDLRTRVRRAKGLLASDGLSLSSDDDRLHPEVRLNRLGEELAAYRESGSRVDEMRVLIAIGIARYQGGNARLARHDFEEALRIARELGNLYSEGAALGNLGNAILALGDVQKAIETYEQQLVIARELSDREMESRALGNLGRAHMDLKNGDKSFEYLEKSLAISREIGDRRGECNDLGSLGNAHLQFGDPNKAISYYEQQLVITREIGYRRSESNAIGNLGNAYRELGDMHKSIEFLERALTIDREIGDQHGEATRLWNLAVSHDMLENRDEAISQATAALAIFDAIRDPNATKVRTMLAALREEHS